MSTLPASASVDQIPPHHFLYLATDSTEAKMYFGTGEEQRDRFGFVDSVA